MILTWLEAELDRVSSTDIKDWSVSLLLRLVILYHITRGHVIIAGSVRKDHIDECIIT